MWSWVDNEHDLLGALLASPPRGPYPEPASNLKTDPADPRHALRTLLVLQRLVSTSRLHGAHPYTYLVDVPQRIIPHPYPLHEPRGADTFTDLPNAQTADDIEALLFWDADRDSIEM